jgi:hypothetical protein
MMRRDLVKDPVEETSGDKRIDVTNIEAVE